MTGDLSPGSSPPPLTGAHLPRPVVSGTSNCCGLPVLAVDRCWISRIWPCPTRTCHCGNCNRKTTGPLELKAHARYDENIIDGRFLSKDGVGKLLTIETSVNCKRSGTIRVFACENSWPSKSRESIRPNTSRRRF